MTDPKVTTKYMKGALYGDRWYVHDETGDSVPGVSAIKSMYPAPALENWFKKATAEYCVDHVDAVSALAERDREGAIELVKGATSRHSKKAAGRGTEVHALCEQVMRDLLEGKKSSFQVTKDDMMYLRNFARFIKEFNVKPVMVETTIWDHDHRFAGTFDLLAKIDGYDGLSIIDTKSGQSGIYHDAGVQQTAYSWAEFYINEAGEFVDMPQVKQAFGLWLRPDGWALIPLRTDDVMWAHFLRLRELYAYKEKIQDTVVGRAVNENPLKKKWRGNK